MIDDPAILDEFHRFAKQALAVDHPTLSPSLLSRLRAIAHPPVQDVDAPEVLPEFIASYRVLRERGRGGMGIVYEAEDMTLNRRVAVKVLTTSRLTDPKARERFVREARTAAGLQHDHIVPVYAAETPPDGPPFIVMPFIDGPTLALRLRQPPTMTFQDIAELIRQIADALTAIHSVGIIHRDVKPGNILLYKGRAQLSDFGLALVTDTATTFDNFAGTPNYISPEQITRPEDIDARSDVYALGATLYECLTGIPPFRGAPFDVVRMAVEDEPVPPRRINRTVPVDLEIITLKCLEKNPNRRYQTAADLRDDLDRFLHSRPILARPAGRWERVRKWVRRNPAPAAALAITTTAVIVLSLLANKLREANRAEALSNDALRRARAESDEAFELSRDALSRVVDRLAERLFEVPKAHPVMLESLADAVDLNEKLAALRPADAAAQERFGNSLNRLGAVQMLCGQLDQANATWQKFQRFLETATQRHPNELAIQLLRYELWSSQLTIASKRNDAPARALARSNARAVVDELATRFADNPKVLRLLFDDRLQTIIDRRREKNWTDAVEAADEAFTALAKWDHAQPGTVDAPQLRGFVLVLKARSLVESKDFSAASNAADDAVTAYSDPRLESLPERDRDWNLLQAKKIRAEIATAAGHSDADLRQREVEALLRRQLRDFPEEESLREDLIRTLKARGDLTAPIDTAAAKALYLEAHALAKKLAADSPHVPRYAELFQSLGSLVK